MTYQRYVPKSPRFLFLSRVIVVAAILVSLMQETFFILGGFWTTYNVVSMILFAAMLYLTWKYLVTHNVRFVGLVLFVFCVQLGIFVVKLVGTEPPFTYRLLQVAIVVTYFTTVMAILLAAFRGNVLTNTILLLISVAVVCFLGEAGLELLRISKDKNHTELANVKEARTEWKWSGWPKPHPDLGFYYAPYSSLKIYYPDNPRGYFKEEVNSEKWRLEKQEGNAANLVLPPDNTDMVRIAIKEAKTKTPWHIQLNKDWLSVKSNHRYAILFRARADSPRTMALGFAKAHEPWENLGLHKNIELKPEWQNFNTEFVATADDDNACIHFDVGGNDIPVELSDIILRSLPEGETIEPILPPKRYFVDYRFNALGCRGRDYSIPRSSNTVRIVLLGDSYTMGVGVHEEDTFGYQLERLLNEESMTQNSGNIYEVINCGVSGFGTREERLFYQLFAARYEPDIVLLTMVENDDMSFEYEIKKGYVDRKPAKLESLFYIWGSIQAYRHKRPFPDFSACVGEILQLQNAVQKQGACLAVMLFRNNTDYGAGYINAKIWDSITKTVREGLQGTGIPILALGEKLREKYPHENLFVHKIDFHPNEIAHATAAQEILSFLKREDMLSPRCRVH
jgi:hypothetical protein